MVYLATNDATFISLHTVTSRIAFLPLTIINFIAALYLPYFTEKLGNTNVLLLGQIILTLGLIVTASLNPLHGYWLAIGIPMLLVGLGQGWLLAPITSAGIHEVDASLSGAASGMTNTMHQLGGPIGLSIIVFFTSNITHIIHYYHVVMWLIVIYMIIGFIVLWMTQRQTKSI